MEKEIHGYKAFNSDGTNCDGQIMTPGNYHCDGKISYRKNGFDFAVRLEDAIRTVDPNQGEPLIAEVIGSGIIREGSGIEDEYYGYYDIYVCSDLQIVRFLSHKDIVSYGLYLDQHRLKRLIYLGIFTNDELEIFASVNSDNRAIVEEFKKYQKEQSKVLKIGAKHA